MSISLLFALSTNIFRGYLDEGAVNAATAAEMISDGTSLMLGDFMAVGTPERFIYAFIKRNAKELTIIANNSGPNLGA